MTQVLQYEVQHRGLEEHCLLVGQLQQIVQLLQIHVEVPPVLVLFMLSKPLLVVQQLLLTFVCM